MFVNDDGNNRCEFHVDGGKIFQDLGNENYPFVEPPATGFHLLKVIIFGQDEFIFFQSHSTCKQWVGPSGEREKFVKRLRDMEL